MGEDFIFGWLAAELLAQLSFSAFAFLGHTVEEAMTQVRRAKSPARSRQ